MFATPVDSYPQPRSRALAPPLYVHGTTAWTKDTNTESVISGTAFLTRDAVAYRYVIANLHFGLSMLISMTHRNMRYQKRY